MEFILKAFVWDVSVDNESIKDKTHYTGKKEVTDEQWNCSSVGSLKKIDVPFLIENIINFEQGKGKYIWKKIYFFPLSLSSFFLPSFPPF